MPQVIGQLQTATGTPLAGVPFRVIRRVPQYERRGGSAEVTIATSITDGSGNLALNLRDAGYFEILDATGFKLLAFRVTLLSGTQQLSKLLI